MLVNKKLDRFKQWAGEKMGGEARTALSDEFKALELEMNLRHEGSHPIAIVTRRPVAPQCTNQSDRHGQNAEINDRLREINVQTRRGRR
jgi:hypothetical protein